jgi:hypothetical protein
MSLVATAAVVTVSAVGPAALAAPAAPACSSTAPDQASALRVAKVCARRVEDVSRWSETGQVFANPDRSSTVERSVRPRFVKTMLIVGKPWWSIGRGRCHSGGRS